MSAHESLAALHAQWKTAIAEKKTATATGLENRMIRENINLARQQVSKLMRRMTTQMQIVEEADLLQAACIGMMTAWRKWVPERARFSTYAAHWIRHEVQDYISDTLPIYRPRQSGKPWQIHRKQEQIRAQYGREATAEELGVTQAQLHEWNSAPKYVGSLDEALPAAVVAKSAGIHQGAGADAGTVGLHEALPDKKPNPEMQFEHAELAAILADGMVDLDEREAFVIDALFIEQLSYKQVCAALDLSEETVRQARQSALEKLRAKVVE